MKQKNYFLLLILTFFQLVSNAQTLDQSNTSYDAGQLILNPNYPHLAQSFTNGLTGMLSRISVDIQQSPVYPTIAGDFDLTIYAGEGVNGTVLLTHTFSVADNFFGELVVNFTPVSVTSGTVNTFKISPSASSTGRLLVSMKGGNNYSGGILYNGNFGASTDYDLWFKTYVTAPTSTPATHLNFDGVNDYVSLTNDASFQLSEGTVEAWVKIPSDTSLNSDYRGIVVKQYAYGLFIYNRELVAYDWRSGQGNINTGINIADDTWHHVAMTFVDGGELKIYLDGVLLYTDNNFGIENQTVGCAIGAGNNSGSIQKINADIDEVRIWNVIKSTEQIAGAMTCELQGNESGLIAYYPFNQGTDQADNSTVTTLTDATANANNGTLTNFALTGATSNWLAGSPITTGSTVPSTPAAPGNITICGGEDTNAIVVNRVCGTVAEGNTLTLTAPTGFTFTSVPFASYGNPNGSCGSYTLGSCHAATSQSIVETALVGQNSASINATNAVFGDPCNGTSKRLYVEALYGSVTWTNDTPSIGLAANGTGAIPAFTAVNNTESPIVATITISYNNGSCRAINSFTITVNPQPATPVVSDQSFCSAATANDLVPAISSTTNWYASASSTTPLVSTDVLSTATYYVSETNANGCESTRAAVSITISSPVVITTQPQDQTIIETEDLVFTVAAANATSYQWEVSMDGGSNWLALDDSFANPDVSGSTTNTLTVSGNNMMMVNGYLFRVILGSSPCEDVISDEALATVTLSAHDFSVDNGIKIYPNPFLNEVIITFQDSAAAELKVLDINGRLLKNQKLTAAQNTIDMNDLPSGLYLFQITSDTKTTTQKVIKK
jgi:hypothetical protein